MTVTARERSFPGRLASQKARRATEGEIYGEIYSAILDHRLPPGTKLPEDSVGEIFGVSRTVVRGVLGRLAHENIVEVRPYRTAIVSRPSIKDAHDVFRARMVIEDEIVGQAARAATGDQISKLRDMVAEEKKAAADGDRRSQIRLSGAFHLALAEICGNDVLTQFLGELVSRTSLIIALYEAPGNSACVFDDHGALIDRISAGDAAAAAGSMRAHLEHCRDRLRLVEADRAVDLAGVFRDHRPGDA
jgi:DNA-binding GntR family transcriptional regulator